MTVAELICVPWDYSHAYTPGDEPDDVEGIEWEDVYTPPGTEEFPVLDVRLTQKFPFSIPWDIGRLLGVFYAKPVAPKWSFDVPFGDVVYPIALDLGEYESIASISRWFFRISWVVFLLFVTNKIFNRGGNSLFRLLTSVPDDGGSGGIPVLEWLASGFVWFFGLMESWYESVLNRLPDSPFLVYQPDAQLLAVMPAVNWLIPVGDMITITAAWLSACAAVYAVIVILRWVKAL